MRKTTRILPYLLGLALLGCGSQPKVAETPSVSATTKAHEHGKEEGHKEQGGHEDHEGHEGHEHHEGKEGHLEFDAVKQKAAKLRTETVQLRPFAGEFQASGSLSYDKDLQVRVTSTLPGKAVELRARVGETVRAGQILAVIDSPELVSMRAEYHEAETNLLLARQSLERRRSLAVYGEEVRRPLDEAKNEVATAQADVRIATSEVEVNRLKLRRTEQLYSEGITSRAQIEQARADFNQARARLRLAEEKLKVARAHLAREQRVFGLGLVANRELQEAQAEVARQDERVRHLRERLVAVRAELEGEGSLLSVTAPISGVVTDRPITLGESITTEEDLFTLADTKRLWLWVNVLESQLARLRTGQRVEVEVPAYPQRTFEGVISYVAPELDEKTRTAQARVVIENRSELLRPAMFARVRVATGGQSSLVVPASALQNVENLDVVYVQEGEDEFARRPVAVGERSGELVQIKDGLKPGERVVVEAGHILKAEDLKSTLEEGGHSH